MDRAAFPNPIYLIDAATLELVIDPKVARDLPNRQRYIQAPEHGVDWERVARAETHELRVQVLDALTKDGGRVTSPNELATELDEALNNLSYHVRQLAQAEILELVSTRPRRGAVEHFYRLSEATR